MRRRHSIVVTALAVCLTFTGSFNPAFAGGLIPTESLVAPMEVVAPQSDSARIQRDQLHTALVAAGVEPVHARQRLAVLSDAEVARLSQELHDAPAGAAWFMPFLLVAAVIGVLITSRSVESPKTLPTTDLFGRPRIAVAP